MTVTGLANAPERSLKAIMRGLLNAVGWLTVLGCAVITLAANFTYGLHVTSGVERWVFALGGAFLDGAKTILPIALGTLLTGRINAGSFARLLLGSVFWTLAVVWSLFCAMQLYEASRVERVGSVEAGKVSYQQHKDAKAAAEAAIAKLETERSVETIKGDLGAARVDRLWSRTRECTDATATESREFCARLARLAAEQLTARAAADIKAALAEERAKLAKASGGMEGANLVEILVVTDAGTQGLANALGWPIETTRYRLALFFAVLLDAWGGLGGWLLTGGHLPRWRRRKPGEPEEGPEEVTATPGPAPAPAAEAPPPTPVGLWAKEGGVARRAGSYAPAAEAFEAFNSWAAVNGHETLNKTAFGRAMTDLGFKRDKRGGVAIYLDVAVPPKPRQAGLRVVASRLSPALSTG